MNRPGGFSDGKRMCRAAHSPPGDKNRSFGQSDLRSQRAGTNRAFTGDLDGQNGIWEGSQ